MKDFERKVELCPKFLSPTEVMKIHKKSITILNNTGIEVNHTEALKLLKKAGARVNFKTQRAKIPLEIIEQCLETLPDRCILAARNPNKDCFLIPGGRPYSRNGGGLDYTLDLETDEKRPLTREDMRDYFKLIDALEHIEFVAAVFGHDLPVIGRDILVLREMLANTDKHVHIRTYSKESLEFMFKICEVVAGSKERLKKRPIISLLEAPVSPMKYIEISVEGLWLCGEYGIPLELCIMPICGATGPITLAGNVLLMNIEFLGCVVLSQLAHPGAPLEYAPRPMIMDMSTGIGLTGSIEGAMMSAASAQMAHYYNVPLSLHGPWTDSLTYDGQSTLERTNFTFISGLSGAHVLSGAGMLEQGITFSHVQLVIDDEINNALYHVLEGFKSDEEHLGSHAISRVEPGGNFIADKHTLQFLREERQSPNILYRNSRESWLAEGCKGFKERAKERVKDILQKHQPAPLPDDIGKAIDDLTNDALRSLKN